MDFCGPPKDVGVNLGPCYPKAEKNQSCSTFTYANCKRSANTRMIRGNVNSCCVEVNYY